MATISGSRDERIFTISKWTGLNESPDGDTKLKSGQGSVVQNWTITRDNNLRRRNGYRMPKYLGDVPTDLIIGEGEVKGIFSGFINGIEMVLAACDGHLYKIWQDGWIKEDLGVIDTTNRVTFFPFSGIVYILNGVEYYQYDGYNLNMVLGYRPLIEVATTPEGEGSLLEEVNKLNGMRRQWFSPDGKANEFVLAEQNIVSADYVKFNDTDTLVLPSDYSIDLVNGKITFNDIPQSWTYALGSGREFSLTNPDEKHYTINGIDYAKLNGVALKDKAEYEYDAGTYTVTFPEDKTATSVKLAYTSATENFTGDGEKAEFELNNADFVSSVIRVDGVIAGYDGSCYTYDDNDKLVIAGAPKKDAAISVQETYANAEETFSGTATATEYTLTNGKVDSISLAIDGEEYKQTEITFPIYPFMSTVVMENEATWIGKFARPSSIVANNYYFFYVLAESTWKYNGTSAAYNASTATACDLLTDYGIRYTGTPNDMDCIQVKDDIRWYTTVASNFVTKFKVNAATGTDNIKVSETRSAVLTETFTGDGKTTTYTLTNKKADSLKVTIDNVEYPRQACTFDSENNKYVFIKAPKDGAAIVVNETFPASYEEGFSGDSRKTFTSKNTGFSNPVIKVDGTAQKSYAEYSYDNETHKITINENVTLSVGDTISTNFKRIPVATVNNIEVGYSAINTYRGEVVAMKYAETFSGTTEMRVFLYGNGTNEVFYSSIDYDGNPRADYFPDLNEIAVGDKNTPITGLIRHLSALIAYKTDSTYSIAYGLLTLADGSQEAAFYVTSINKILGNEPLGMVQLVLNSPYTIVGHDLYEWSAASRYSTAISKDERTAKRVSDNIYDTIGNFDTANVYTFDDNVHQEYYICNPAKAEALVWNYAVNAWYYYNHFPMYSACMLDGDLIFGSTDGKIEIFSDDYYSDNGEAFESIWESGSLDFGKPYERKFSPEMWIVIKPESRGHVGVTVRTDRKSDFAVKDTDSTLMDFWDIDFSDISFTVNRSPKTYRHRLKAKKFTYYKLRLESNDAETGATVLNANFKVRFTGFAK